MYLSTHEILCLSLPGLADLSVDRVRANSFSLPSSVSPARSDSVFYISNATCPYRAARPGLQPGSGHGSVALLFEPFQGQSLSHKRLSRLPAGLR